MPEFRRTDMQTSLTTEYGNGISCQHHHLVASTGCSDFQLNAINRDRVLVLCRPSSDKYPQFRDINVRRGIIRISALCVLDLGKEEPMLTADLTSFLGGEEGSKGG